MQCQLQSMCSSQLFSLLNSEICPSSEFPLPSLSHALCPDLHYNNRIDILSLVLKDKGCLIPQYRGFSGGAVVRNLLCNAGDMGSIPGSGRSPRVGNGNPLQYSCLKNPMDRGALRATVHEVAKSQTWLSIHTMLCYLHMIPQYIPES